MIRKVLRSAVPAVLFALLGALAPASASADAPPLGPPVGNVKYRATIEDQQGSADTDDYTQKFLKGERLDVVVQGQGAKGEKRFAPILVLLDPDGVERFAEVLYSSDLSTARLNSFGIDKSGLWAVRVTGRDGDQGEYVITLKVKPFKKLKFRKQELGNDQPFSRTHTFPAFDGADMSAKLTYDRRSIDMEMRALLDPSGADVLDDAGDPAVEAAVAKKRKVTLDVASLSKGDGDYSLRVRIPTAIAKYDLDISVDPGERPKSGKVKSLSSNEPFLVARATPLAGETGDVIRVQGGNFSTGTAPTVLFGDSPGTNVDVSPDGTFLDVVIPARTGAAVVPLYVVNPDGQAGYRDLYFAFIPPPIVFDLFDVGTGAQVRTSSANAGRALRLTGDNFLVGQVLTIGTQVVPTFTVVSEFEIRFNQPQVVDGSYTLSVTDEFQRSATTTFEVLFKTPPSFASPTPYAPGAVQISTPTLVTITGAAFQASDQLVFNGAPVASTFVSSTARTFSVPALPAGSYSVQLIDSIGTVVDGPPLDVKAPPAITGVSVTIGPVLGAKDIPLAGGATVQVTGSGFAGSDLVRLGGTTVTDFVTRSSSGFTFIAPAGAAGPAALTVTDGSAQTATFNGAVNYVGMADVTAAAIDASGAVDDFSAVAAASGDLDADGLDDDAVIVSPFGTQIGTRGVLTRIFLGDAGGKLRDRTSTSVPPAGSDTAGFDKFDANAVAVGDVDGGSGDDIVIAGVGSSYDGGMAYPESRLFLNKGSGSFRLEEAYGLPSRYVPRVYCTFKYYSGYTQTIYTAVYPQGSATAVALGDLDNDGDTDVLVGHDHFDYRGVRLDPSTVDFSYSPPKFVAGSGYYYYAKRYRVNYGQYISAVRLFDNRIDEGYPFADLTQERLPKFESNKNGVVLDPVFHTRDLAIGDLDGQNGDDIVVAWDDPTTVTAYGLTSKAYYGTSYDVPRVATRILLNDGYGTFSDETGTWMPIATGDEFWQADRAAVEDLDGDADLDLVLVHADGLDAYKGDPTHKRSALRVLRNESNLKFTDVTSTAIPAVSLLTGDDYRGGALLVADVTGDGLPDIVVGTTERLATPAKQSLRRTRIFAGIGNLRWTLAAEFTVDITIDTGEAADLAFLPDLGGVGKNRILVVSDVAPTTSPAGEHARVQEWRK